MLRRISCITSFALAFSSFISIFFPKGIASTFLWTVYFTVKIKLMIYKCNKYVRIVSRLLFSTCIKNLLVLRNVIRKTPLHPFHTLNIHFFFFLTNRNDLPFWQGFESRLTFTFFTFKSMIFSGIFRLHKIGKPVPLTLCMPQLIFLFSNLQVAKMH